MCTHVVVLPVYSNIYIWYRNIYFSCLKFHLGFHNVLLYNPRKVNNWWRQVATTASDGNEQVASASVCKAWRSTSVSWEIWSTEHDSLALLVFSLSSPRHKCRVVDPRSYLSVRVWCCIKTVLYHIPLLV